MGFILRTDLKYLNKENKKASHKFVRASIIISLFIYLYYCTIITKLWY